MNNKKSFLYLVVVLFIFKHLQSQPVCNGFAELCDRRYNEVTFPATHNAQSYKGASGWTGWLVSVQNQDKSITEQLNAGIRAMKIPLHLEATKKGNIVTACHGLQAGDLRSKAPRFTPQFVIEAIERHPSYYDKGAQPFKDLVKEVKIFLDAHPNEVFTFFLEDQTLHHEMIIQAFNDAGMNPETYMHIQNKRDKWPMLGQMIESGKRVVVFINNKGVTGTSASWLHQFDDFVWQTEYSFGDVQDLKDDTKDPGLRNSTSKVNYNNRFMAPQNKISVVQHFVTPSVKSYTLYLGGKKSEAQKANSRDVLFPRLKAVYAKAKSPLNFIWVDFFEYGDLFDIVNQLNGVGTYKDKNQWVKL
jgi:hypothetical protein